MNIKFLNDINANYMMIEDIPDFFVNDFSLKLLEKNKIKGLLDFDHEVMDGRTNMIYNTTSKDCFAKKYSSSKMCFEDLKILLFSLKSLIRKINGYLLDPDNIIFKKECIFIDRASGRYEYCYFPFYHGDLLLELREFFSQLLGMIDYNDQKAVRLAYDIQKISMSDSFTLNDITKIAGEISIDKQPEERSEREEHSFDNRKSEKSIDRDKPEDKKEGFLNKAGIYFKETGTSQILSDINTMKIIKKIKQQNVNYVADKKNVSPERKKEKEKNRRDTGNDEKALKEKEVPIEIEEIESSVLDGMRY